MMLETTPPTTSYEGSSRRVEKENAPRLNGRDIAEFRAIMEESCGLRLGEQEAWTRATELVNLYRMLLGPIPEDPHAPS
jgi:hypothetical protein